MDRIIPLLSDRRNRSAIENRAHRTVDLSIIIVSYNAKKTIERCLASLEDPGKAGNVEIIVVDSSTDGTGDLVARRFPSVCLYRFAKRKYPGDARNAGILRAKGKIIAFTDADCKVAANWTEEILKSHRRPDLAVGGAVANGNTRSPVSWAAYFCKFYQCLPEDRHCLRKDLPTANMSYKRDIFTLFGLFQNGTYSEDSEFHWRIISRGGHIVFVPSIIVTHFDEDNYRGFLKERLVRGLHYARIRCRYQSFSRIRRFMYGLFIPVPALKVWIGLSIRVLANHVFARQYLRVLPWVIPGLLSWALGECIGYLKGSMGDRTFDRTIRSSYRRGSRR